MQKINGSSKSISIYDTGTATYYRATGNNKYGEKSNLRGKTSYYKDKLYSERTASIMGAKDSHDVTDKFVYITEKIKDNKKTFSLRGAMGLQTKHEFSVTEQIFKDYSNILNNKYAKLAMKLSTNPKNGYERPFLRHITSAVLKNISKGKL